MIVRGQPSASQLCRANLRLACFIIEQKEPMVRMGTKVFNEFSYGIIGFSRLTFRIYATKKVYDKL